MWHVLFDILDMGVCTTMHWQTSGRLMQVLKVCTVHTHVGMGHKIESSCLLTDLGIRMGHIIFFAVTNSGE